MDNPKVKIKEAIEAYTGRTSQKMNIIMLATQIKADVTVKTVENYLHQSIEGKRSIPVGILIQVSEILGVTTDFLLGLSNIDGSIRATAEKIDSLTTELSQESHKLGQQLTKD